MIPTPGSRHSIYGCAFVLLKRNNVFAGENPQSGRWQTPARPDKEAYKFLQKFTVMTLKVAYQDQWVSFMGFLGLVRGNLNLRPATMKAD
ncbi:hypothetical protein BK797_14050 [Kosakonia sacchari]|nr:hypothetical protein BK797_14050 [Kosakonia sacchari]